MSTSAMCPNAPVKSEVSHPLFRVADGVLFNLISPDDAYPYFEGSAKAVQQSAGGMAIVQVSDIHGLATAVRAAAGPVVLTLDPSDPTWGFVRVRAECGHQPRRRVHS